MQSDLLITVEVLHNTRSAQIVVIGARDAPKLRLDPDRCVGIVEVGSSSWSCCLPKSVQWTHPVQLIHSTDHFSLRLTLEPFGPCDSVLLQNKAREAQDALVMPRLQQANNQLICRLCGKAAFVSGAPFSKVCCGSACSFFQTVTKTGS
jgi:hypothetical protein